MSICVNTDKQSNDSTLQVITRSDDKCRQMDERLKHLETICHTLDEDIDDIDNNLIQQFDCLKQIIAQNNRLLTELQTKQETNLKEIITKCQQKISVNTSNEWTETDLMTQLSTLKNSVELLTTELVDKKRHKTDLTNKTKCLAKKLEEMETKVKELRQQNHTNDNEEHMVLAAVMRVMYKTYHNNVIGLLFNDNEEKNLEKVLVMDNNSDNKSEHKMSKQFWDSLNADYNIN
ncbi:uncharacterized protein LOC128960420 [Oppia nitens]|uniref:uncharacterized protein LOC128960420 n=1 Tax=Oppia nitens TaxID=1686743 RepID=UPI0023DB29B8|nr:uncharacterized protein LOC128960420 [Oppia nitens]